MRRVPAPAIWSIVLIALPFAVLAMLGILGAIAANPTTTTIASVGPALVIGSWIVSLPVGIVTVVAVRGRWRFIGIAAIVLALLEPIILLVVWIGSG